MWLLCWWPYAIAHGLNPMLTHAVWAPHGFDLAWTTSIPLPALVAAPLTRAFGPVAAYNVLCIAAPAATAWSGFLLCRHLTARYWAALTGGYVFGFSAYMLAEIRGHLPLVLVFPPALALLLSLRRLEERISSWRFALLLAAVLVTAFLCWAELYATMTFFGVIALGLAAFFGERSLRERLRRLLMPVLTAYTVSLIVVLPYLYYFFQPGYPRSSINSPRAYSADLLNIVLPTPVNALGGIGLSGSPAFHFAANSLESGAYFGLPLLAITLWFAWERWREPFAKLLLAFLVIVCVLMSGPRLHVNGHELWGMPWKIALHVPLLRDALPVRFSVYACLDLAIIASIWLSTPRRAVVKIAAVMLLLTFLLPNMHSGFWSRTDDTPEFFKHGDYQRYLTQEENVVVLPYGINGTSMLWQAAAGFHFRMAGGWTSLTPHEFETWPIVNAMLTRTYLPDITSQLCAFMAGHDVRAIIVNQLAAPFWERMLAPLDRSPIRIGGVVMYRPARGELAACSSFSALEMERRNNLARFAVLLRAARDYLAQNRDPAALTPMHARSLGLLPADWVNDPDVRTNNGLFLGRWDKSEVAVGLVGTFRGVQPLVGKYGATAARIFFPFPRKLIGSSPPGDALKLLLMVFDREGLAQAVHAGESAP